MSNYSYEAVDAGGLSIRGTLEVADQSEALKRIKEMGLFPTRIAEAQRRPVAPVAGARRAHPPRSVRISLPGRRVSGAVLAAFTRQLATLLEAGMPLLRGLRTLRDQAGNRALKRIVAAMSDAIEGGASLSEALLAWPRVFNGLYVNMVRAGELGGALDVTLRRLADFMEKAQKVKGRIKAALFYPTAVLLVALAILSVMMIFVIPRFQQVFDGLLGSRPMPAFTEFVFGLSGMIRNHWGILAVSGLALAGLLLGAARTRWGCLGLDWLKLTVPVLGPVFRKTAISRFARTLGTLLASGVPVLQALTIVKDAVGNRVIGRLVGAVHESVKQGDTIATPLRQSRVFPAMVAGMVDIGEQTGALPDMLTKIAEIYDEEVDNAVNAMTSLLEPIMIVFLAVIVGSIVIAMFLPIIVAMTGAGLDGAGGGGDVKPRDYSRNRESMGRVTGPSLARVTIMWAPNSPVWTGFPRSCSSFAMNFR